MLPPLPKFGTVHPMVESLPPPIGHSKRNARIGALFTPLVVRWLEQFLIGVVVAFTSQKSSKKGTTMMMIDKYHPNTYLTRTLTHHCSLGMHFALSTPFATLFCCSADGSGWNVLFLGTTKDGGVARGMATSSWGNKMWWCWWMCPRTRANRQEGAPFI
jgi:hypothetical protein